MPKKVIAALGNPGKEFENTYHNAGALLMAHELTSMGYGHGFKKYKTIFEYAAVGEAVFVRPLSYMNESGQAIRESLKKFGVKPEALIVLHDESDLALGSYKISFGRSSAGHKGVQSIIDAIGTNEFTRVRIGIRPATEKIRKKAGDFALKQIAKKDSLSLEKVFGEIEKDQRADGVIPSESIFLSAHISKGHRE